MLDCALAGARTAITSHAGALDALLLGSAVVAHGAWSDARCGASRYSLRVHDALERAGAGAPAACVLAYSAGTRSIRARTAALLLCTTLFALYTAQAHAPAL